MRAVKQQSAPRQEFHTSLTWKAGAQLSIVGAIAQGEDSGGEEVPLLSESSNSDAKIIHTCCLGEISPYLGKR
jgi:hypothetical protein